jgi:hypothetical protein
MNISRDVILDLLPLYVAGEASPATRALVEEYLSRDPVLAQRVRTGWDEELARGVPSALPPELEMRALRRTRRLLGLQKWLFGFAIGFSVVSLTSQISFDQGRLTDFHLLIRDHPVPFGISMAIGVACWVGHHLVRRRLRFTAP